ncbi:MAG: efflux RND transporter permease subunit [Myxococcota bacterium]
MSSGPHRLSEVEDAQREEDAGFVARARGLAATSIRRAVTTTMLYLGFGAFGLFALLQLPVNQLPEVELPVIAVVTTYTGASPADVETLLTEPLERAVSGVAGAETVTSTSRQGASLVLISFTWGTDMAEAEVAVRKNLDIFAGELLPGDATKPLTFAFDPSLAPVMFLALEGPLDGHQLRRLAIERVQPYLGRLEGVAAAEVIGGLERQVQVRPKLRRLQALGISPAQLVDAIRAANVVTPSGALDDGTQAMNLQPTGLFEDIDQIRDVVVAYRGDRAVLLRDVAEVVDGFEEETHVVTSNGARAVTMAIRKQSDANTVQTARTVRDALAGVVARLPEGVRITPLFDESASVVRAVTNLGLTAVQAFFLTGLVLLIFLRSWRTSLVAVVAVPTSILLGFAVMQWLDVTLNLISMAGLALAIGMLVDNGIVVLEAAFQELEKGKSAPRAALEGAKEMSLPLFASTLTTVVVFLPILLVEGIAGELFRDLVLTISVSLLCSLLVALTLVPLMASRFANRDTESVFAKRMLRLTGGLDDLPPAYERLLAGALRHRKRVLLGAFGGFALAVLAVPFLGQDFLPKSDVSQLRLELEAAPGTSIDEMRALVGEAEAIVETAVPEAEVISADYGASEGFAALFGATANRGTMRVRLPPPGDRARSQQEIEAALAPRFRTELAGLEVRIEAFSLGGAGGDIALKVFADDLEVLRDYGERIRDRVARVEGVEQARFSMVQGSPELELDLDRSRMRQLGIAPAEVTSAVAIVYQGETATFFRDDEGEHSIRVRAARNERGDLDRLRYLPIPLPQASGEASPLSASRFIPLSAVAEVRDQLGPVDIEHESQRRLATVALTVEGRNLGSVVRDVEEELRAMELPEGVQVITGGAAEDLRDAFMKLALALLAALTLVYMVMASQFESLVEPFVIMFTVPLASVGVVLALMLTGTTLQVTALVGVILLGGVIVNNGIVLIDVLKRRRAEGRDLVDAALEAARTRLRPILMTALTTILGMFPLALGIGDGAETWAPMARAVIGGMIVGTALTLFVIPVLYVSVRGYLDRPRGERVSAEEESPREVDRAAPVSAARVLTPPLG